jgi:hypothetical protein
LDREEIAREWQRQRSRFNHDWLKNQYTQALGKWINILHREVDDPMTERNFIARVLPEWTAHRPELIDLLNRFECAMSPRRLFELPPLLFCDQRTHEWLPDVMHTLWKRTRGERGGSRCRRDVRGGPCGVIADRGYVGGSRSSDDRCVPATTLGV